ncbi:Hypothetical predicted protein [Paramuricea clavata]|uniref:Uncharacterized protein n=1 Tax=Paramuricea clavata TaxID=317549 RepID=A0A6S7GX60_PARCT|nr:Hypothetical predicted protein [Paramuricea clavata]
MVRSSAAQLTKSQVQQMRDWRMKYGQSVPQKTVRNMTTKDNPGTLPINLYAQAQPASEPLDFSKITENGTQTDTRQANTHNLLHSTGDVIFLASYANSGQMMIYQLQENVSASTKKARATIFEGDPFNPLYLQKKELSRSMRKKHLVLWWKPFAGDSDLELTENEFLR